MKATAVPGLQFLPGDPAVKVMSQLTSAVNRNSRARVRALTPKIIRQRNALSNAVKSGDAVQNIVEQGTRLATSGFPIISLKAIRIEGLFRFSHLSQTDQIPDEHAHQKVWFSHGSFPLHICRSGSNHTKVQMGWATTEQVPIEKQNTRAYELSTSNESQAIIYSVMTLRCG